MNFPITTILKPFARAYIFCRSLTKMTILTFTLSLGVITFNRSLRFKCPLRVKEHSRIRLLVLQRILAEGSLVSKIKQIKTFS